MAAKPRPKSLPVLTFEQIEQTDDLKPETVEVPEWGGSVVVKGASKEVYDAWLTMESPADGYFLLSKTLIEPAITEAQAEVMKKKSAAAMSRVEAAILRLSSAQGAERRFLAGDSGE